MKKSDVIEALAGVDDDEEVVILLYRRQDYVDPKVWIEDGNIAFTVPDQQLWNKFVNWFQDSMAEVPLEVGTAIGDCLLQFYREDGGEDK